MRMLSEAWEGQVPPPDFGGGRTDWKMVTSTPPELPKFDPLLPHRTDRRMEVIKGCSLLTDDTEDVFFLNNEAHYPGSKLNKKITTLIFRGFN